MLTSSKKIFALVATASVVGALAFGCSSSTTESSGTDDSTDSGIKCKKGQTVKKGKCVTAPTTDDTASTDDTGSTTDSGTTKDSGTSKDGSTSGSCYDASITAGYSTVTFPTTHANQPGKCSDGNIATFASVCGTDLAADTDATCFAKIKSTTPAACQQCLYSEFAVDGGMPANVGPFFVDSNGNNINVVGCLSIVTGIAGCGEKFANNYFCTQENQTACDSACPTDDGDVAYNACLDSAETACATKVGYDTACATAIQNSGDVCFTPELADAGTGVAEAQWVTALAGVFCK